LRRLFSTFAPGWPGVGLLFLRLVAGTAVIIHGFPGLRTGLPIAPIVLNSLAIVVGMLLLLGLWTPVSGSLVGAFGLWNAIFQSGGLEANILLGTIGAALALVGPGAWSVDARLFGWRRIEIREPEN
jgi:putative oxidoreductase